MDFVGELFMNLLKAIVTLVVWLAKLGLLWFMVGLPIYAIGSYFATHTWKDLLKALFD